MPVLPVRRRRSAPGALLALPPALLVRAVLVDADPQARWGDPLLASKPETPRARTTGAAVHQEV